MRLDRAFLLLNLLLILASVAAHEVASGKFVFLVLTVGVCVYVWRRHRRGEPPRLNDKLARAICAVTLIVMLYRAVVSSSLLGDYLLDVRIPVVGRSLIIFQWVYLLLKKRPRDYAWMYLVTIVHMAVAGLLMPGIAYALFFLVYAAIGVCALTVFNMWHESLGTTAGPAQVKLRPSAGFVSLAVAATLLLMLPVAGIFMVLPRRARALRLSPQIARLRVQPVSGFSRTVRLGEIGRIQENRERVMFVTVRDPETGKARRMDGGLLLKGIALDTYYRDEHGRWVWGEHAAPGGGWQRRKRGQAPDVGWIYRAGFPGFETPGYERIQCDISIEALRTGILFAPFAPESIAVPHDRALFAHAWMHAFFSWTRTRPWRPFRYSVVSRIFTPSPPTGEGPALVPYEEILSAYLQLPEELSPEIQALAEQIAPDAECPDDYSKAVRILAYLADDSRFGYTLTMSATPEVEPVEDFLFNRRHGHCEYFASAMTLLLREVGIPARVVNGFKVSEWNPIAGHYVVRQSDAHSWVEAYLRPDGWRTFDPSVMRDAVTPRMLFVRRWWWNLYDTTEMLWVHHVLNYDAETQSRVFRGIRKAAQPLRELRRYAIWRMSRGMLAIERWKRRWPIWKLWPALRSALLITVPLLLAAVAAIGLQRGLRSRRRRTGGATLRFYRKMERLLAQRGLCRQASQTPREFLRALAQRNRPQMEAVSLITRRFCEVRYGGRTLSAAEKRKVSQALQALRRALRPAAGAQSMARW